MGVTPVILTVIIIAVAIVVSISASYWYAGLVNTFTTREDLKIISCYIVYEEEAKLVVHNVGSRDLTINQIHINGSLPYPNVPLSLTLKPGDKPTITISPENYQ